MKRKLKFGHYYVFILITLLSILLIRGCIIKKDIEKSETEIIAKFIKIEKSIKTESYYFGFYYKGEYIETSASGIQHSIINSENENKLIDSLKRKHFYLAKFNPKHPKNIIVNPRKEITNIEKIKNAGFEIDN